MNLFVDSFAAIGGGSLTPFFAVLADTALKGLVLIAAAAIATYVLRKKSAAARHAVWTAAVIGHLALPVLSVLVPQWRIPLMPAPVWLATPDVSQTSTGPASTPVQNVSTSTPAPAATENTIPASASAPVHTSTTADTDAIRWPTISILGMLWILGSVLVLLRLAVGTFQVGRLAKH